MPNKRKQDRDGLFERLNSPYYWASYTDVRGRRVRRSTGIRLSKEGRREAKALLAKWKLEVHREKQWDEKPSRTFDELLVLYLRATENLKRAAERDRTSAKHLYPFFSGMKLSDITGPVLNDYVVERRRVVTAGTINKEIGLLSSAINWAKKERGWEIQNPVDGRRLREPEGRIRWITQEQAEEFLKAAGHDPRAPHLVDFVRLGLHTGMRKGEMLGLDWSRVDLKEGLIYLGAEHQKNGKLGSVPLNGEARRAILTRAKFRAMHCPDSPWVFCSKDGSRVQNVKRSFATACRRAGLLDFRPHDLRHTCAAWLVQSGVSMREVAELLRHADIRVTMRYAHLAPEQVRAAVERLEQITSHSGHTESKRGWLRVV